MILDFTFVHTATVETYRGRGINGADYATGVAIDCYISTVDVVTLGPDGETVTQRNTKLNTDLANAALLTPQSKVTSAQLGGDGVARVASVTLRDSGALALGLDHVEAVLQ